MALIKRKTRKKLSKQLGKLVKRHGPETTLALVSGIISNLTTAAGPTRADRRNAPRPPSAARKRAAPSESLPTRRPRRS